ncbi:uncharacterized protein BDZ99DRAFT_2917 [Mytilinidion resinicola]|uniref:Uncharacterized protein n=1 Tax=Mytilinidion resinicola TaxID=574789 RepID=A0A6A6Z6W1_9PEZI|nr:uncharacterized protein BDZ99DRAFT_2917 [Mytilinidion resinicola]KAF2816842.1 hypothetical protein BDZ99DRAFT_2917 [Mytilinidion resinicola]
MPSRFAARSLQMPPPTGSSPLSPRVESLAIPSQARRQPPPHARQSSTGSSSLRLPSLPRFHPANFPSQHSSSANTPEVGGGNSPQPPPSPRAQQKQYSDAQRQLYMYQRELLATASRSSRTAPGPKPTSPRLIPLGSPGPVTPLELEGHDGYLMSGVHTDDAAAHVDKLIREEAQRRGDISPSRPASVGGR